MDGLGLVDLSLFSATENPLVYCNRSIGDRWQIQFSENPNKLRAFLQARERGCFYFTVSKKDVTPSDLKHSIAESVPSAKAIGVPITYTRLVDHCERILSGIQESLIQLSQRDALRSLLN